MSISILEKIKQRLGIKGLDELRPEEQATFKYWEEQYNLSEITIPALLEFINKEIDKLQDEFPSFNQEKDIYLKARITNFKVIKKAIEAPTVARKMIQDKIDKL